ncbi:hypothetical protein [Aurantibacillus circumpalustris]|uniref:hypothetical protein n=1 Tax=Aurantibacillus circumpalustris TaxID=3036359 RepID=UPI00295A8A06|nr:hypothetical protein [Aurantibacillus circumpalustris]
MIVVTEPLFAVSGAVQHLNKELIKRIGNIKYSFAVKPLVLVDQDFFLGTHDLFKFGKADLFDCIEYYYEKDAQANSSPHNPTSYDFSFLNGFPQHLSHIFPEFDSSAFSTSGTLANIVSTKLTLQKK